MKNITPPTLDVTQPIFTNDLKKGHEIMLGCGWKAIIADNAKGQTRLAEVYGHCTELGSVYSHDIAYYKQGERLYPVSHTDKQLQCKKVVRASGF